MEANQEEKKKSFQAKAAALTTEVKDWYAEQIELEKGMMPPQAGKSDTNIWNVAPAIDSIRVCSISLTVEKHLGFELPVAFIKQGGYAGIDEMMADLMPQLEKQYMGLGAAVADKKKEKAAK
jgi:hypothetical protein